MKSLLRFQRISPQKLRLAAKGLRGARVEEAFRILAGTKNRGGDLLARALRSALAGAGAAPDPHALRVERLLIDGGPILPRHRAMSMGRGGKIRKRSSHIRVELAPIAEKIAAKEPSPKSATRAKEGSDSQRLSERASATRMSRETPGHDERVRKTSEEG